MLGLGPGELLLVGILLIVVVGPERLPTVVRWAGRQYGMLRRAATDLNKAIILEGDISDQQKKAKLKKEPAQEDLVEKPPIESVDTRGNSND